MDIKKDVVFEDSITELVELYYKNVFTDYYELKKEYPFSYLTIAPTITPKAAVIKLLAINKELVELTHASEKDILNNKYSRELWVSIPFKYKIEGCVVYGGKWIDCSKISKRQQHFYEYDSRYGYRLCVGVPDSFRNCNNVILECVRTADHILTAYEDFLSGRTRRIILKEYSHGDEGINEYRKKKEKQKK